jgi:hypothetical protein
MIVHDITVNIIEIIYIECSLESVHILAAKTVALKSGAKTGAA